MNFNTFYTRLIHEFQSNGSVSVLQGGPRAFAWPDGYGVYVIWETAEGKDDRLLYVGKCGTYKRQPDGRVGLNGSTFKARTLRWTPYRFCESVQDREFRFQFRFGPKLSNVNGQAKIKYDSDAYRETIPYASLRVDCLVIDPADPLTSPALLESRILTAYLSEHKTLPPGNNEL
jgi:hypothetical protein